MALVNPQIAMSYRPTTEYQPRNALAEYAQLQSIMGGQRQAEVADMQLEKYRQDRAALDNIRRAIVAKGGPPDLGAAAEEMIRSGNPDYIERGAAILETVRSQRQWEDYQRSRTGATAPASAPGAILGGGAPAAAVPAAAPVVAPAAAVQRSGTAKEIFDEYGEDAAKFFEANKYLPAGMFPRLADQQQQQSRGISREEYAASRNQFRDALRAQGVNVDAPEFNIQPPPASDMAGEFRRDMEARGIRMAPAAAPAAAPVANVLAAQQGATPPESVNQLAAAAPNLQSLLSDYRRVSGINRPEAKAEAQLLLKQIEEAMQSSRAPETIRKMRELGFPITKEGFAEFSRTSQAQAGPRVDIIGVVKGTDTPVYFDKDTRQQFTIGVDASGKQVTVPYTGAVNRSTSTVTAPVDVRVNAVVPASETAQAEYMKGARTTFEALRNAQPTLDNIEKAKALVPGAQGFMGTGGEPLLAAASFLNNRLGTSINTTGVTDAQELRSRLFFGILDNLKKLDSQPSQQQQNALQQALGSIGTDPTALPRVLDAFADSIRTKVNLYNQDVTSAEERGVRFPYRPQIQLKPPSSPGAAAAQIPAGAPAAAAGNTVTLPNGTVMTFPNAEAAAKFKRDARLP